MSTTLAPMPVTSPLPSALEDRAVVIVGGSSGIGLAAGALLVSVGARVTLVARDAARLSSAAERLRTTPGAAVSGITGDGTDETVLEHALDQAGPVDHVLVTAGGFSVGALLDTPREQVRESVDGRIWGAYGAARAAARRLPAGGSITFSSGLYLTRPIPGASAAIASIGAVEGLTRALAVELAPRRLRVNAIRYGVVDTPLSRGALGLGDDAAVAAAGQGSLLGRFATAEEAASAALFLMANNFMTGTVVTVDGGQSLV
ncbi:SDR family oxidoreductase [Nonomuraea gerenzanensis]|uniref:Short-chain dehydrogenase/reductase SDR n=1 Tax=Nonomuraea gerenzanensis TaxID=93944 RepID=A0A1M4ECN4_9ACTN|nr:SDR family oxidoreductase [Nonomuraea gerenzanensis]UBU18710.1 SDR family oxidoreductase [Nonomuraea gerenzanensis]SBO96570.1 short-chain dehydrogenase/reductase SDR [Nonomuraea gerenzanensis]